MRLVRMEDVEVIVRKTVRSTIDYRALLKGTPGTIGNFKLILGTTHADYTTPRHRHNFDQIRLQVGGSFAYDGLGTMSEGMVGYFPEGTAYGPSASGDDSRVLLLQHGGASGWGYLSDSEYNVSIAELKQQGEFHDGVFTKVDASGQKHNKDGYEAVWENAYRRPIDYAKPRYEQPIFMRPENFAWLPQGDGVSYKLLGDFNERHLRIGYLGLAAGATYRLDARSLYFATAGRGTINGQAWGKHATIEIEEGERIDIYADADSEILHLGLPDFANLKRDVPVFAQAR